MLNVYLSTLGEDSLSDTSSSEGDAPMAALNQGGDIRQISRDQLIAALLQAGNTSRNSLSNIAQRNNSTSPNPLSAPSTFAGASSSALPATSTASTSGSGGQSNSISSSFFGNALSQVLSQVQAQAGADAANTTSSQAPANPNQAELYASELVLMQEMGLFGREPQYSGVGRVQR